MYLMDDYHVYKDAGRRQKRRMQAARKALEGQAVPTRILATQPRAQRPPGQGVHAAGVPRPRTGPQQQRGPQAPRQIQAQTRPQGPR